MGLNKNVCMNKKNQNYVHKVLNICILHTIYSLKYHPKNKFNKIITKKKIQKFLKVK